MSTQERWRFKIDGEDAERRANATRYAVPYDPEAAALIARFVK
jgi:hypothetical protein